ncbi:hypothetical protein QEN19_003025 [Hanseniaspora menglaensis]
METTRRDPFAKILKKRKREISVNTPVNHDSVNSENNANVSKSRESYNPAIEFNASTDQVNEPKTSSSVKVIKRSSHKQELNSKSVKPFRLIDPEIPTEKSNLEAKTLIVKKKNINVVKNKHSKKYTIAIDTKKSIRDYTEKELTDKHKRADSNLINSWNSIIAKYEKMGDIDNGSDIIDLTTGKIIEDNGHIQSLAQQDTLKATDVRNKLTKSSTSNDDNFLNKLVEENVVKVAMRRKLDLKRLKSDGILPGLDLGLSDDSDTDPDDESYVLASDDYSSSESEMSEVEVDDDIEGKDYSDSEVEESKGFDKGSSEDSQLSEIYIDSD